MVAAALKEMMATENVTQEAPKDCNNTGDGWETGKKLFRWVS